MSPMAAPITGSVASTTWADLVDSMGTPWKLSEGVWRVTSRDGALPREHRPPDNDSAEGPLQALQAWTEQDNRDGAMTFGSPPGPRQAVQRRAQALELTAIQRRRSPGLSQPAHSGGRLRR